MFEVVVDLMLHRYILEILNSPDFDTLFLTGLTCQELAERVKGESVGLRLENLDRLPLIDVHDADL